MQYETSLQGLKELVENQSSNITGLIVLKDEQIVHEDYFDGYNKNSTIHVASVTKSVLSILIGIAIDKGAIKSIEQKVIEFFPEYKLKRGEKTAQLITIRNLLTMTAPYKYKYEPYTKVYSSNDWTESVLDLLGGKGKIGNFKYTTVGIHLLSSILVNATGQSIRDFSAENLFIPLKIKSPDNVSIHNREEYVSFLKGENVTGWVMDPKGINTAGWGLTLTTRDMIKVGQLYLNKGCWKGKQIVSSEWVAESIKEQSHWGDRRYGYLWWIINEKNSSCYMALGDGGNIIYIDPKKKLVVAISSRFKPQVNDRIEFIQENISPYFN